MTKWERAGHASNTVAAVAALIALAVSAYYFDQSQGTSEEALRTSRDAQSVSAEALRVAKEGQALAADGVHRALANRFYLGEAPDSVGRGTGPQWAVVNANTVDIYRVFVEGDLHGQPTAVRIWTVQACTGYLLPEPDFKPTKSHFFDGRAYWSRGPEGELQEEAKPPFPKRSGLEVATTFEALACA